MTSPTVTSYRSGHLPTKQNHFSLCPGESHPGHIETSWNQFWLRKKSDDHNVTIPSPIHSKQIQVWSLFHMCKSLQINPQTSSSMVSGKRFIWRRGDVMYESLLVSLSWAIKDIPYPLYSLMLVHLPIFHGWESSPVSANKATYYKTPYMYIYIYIHVSKTQPGAAGASLLEELFTRPWPMVAPSTGCLAQKSLRKKGWQIENSQAPNITLRFLCFFSLSPMFYELFHQKISAACCWKIRKKIWAKSITLGWTRVRTILFLDL